MQTDDSVGGCVVGKEERTGEARCIATSEQRGVTTLGR